MKFAISNFDEIKNFAPNLIPVSFADVDPEWYHKEDDRWSTFVDNSGVFNGLYSLDFSFVYNNKESYKEHLKGVNLKRVIELAQNTCDLLQERNKFKKEAVIVFVANKDENEKSEVLKEFLEENNIELTAI